MKIAVILGAFSVGTRPLDYDTLFTNPRGLTGTDLCFIRLSQELKKLGHDVYMFSVWTQKPTADKVYSFDERLSIVDDTFDVIISINEPNILFGMARKPKRIVWQMLNDFSFIKPGFDDEVDLYFGVCQEHTQYVAQQCPKPDKWQTVELGCNPEWYQDLRVPGRVVWCSSADRGLHWLLQQWPEIKQAVPEASLRVFYHFGYQHLDKIEPQDRSQHPHVVEMAQRVRYIKEAIERLKPLGVEHVGSVSREQMVKEWNEASVFGFSCDTVAFSEGFSVSTLEAHASYTVPVITRQDCLGGIYQDSGAIVLPIPIQDHLQEFTQAVIKGLTDKEYADGVITKCRQFAQNHTWTIAADKIIKALEKSIAKAI